MNRRLLAGGALVCFVALGAAYVWQSNTTTDGDAVPTSGAGRGAQGGGDAGGRSGGGSGGRGGSRETLVITERVTEAITGDRLSAIGDGEAVASVALTPRDSGVLVEVFVVSGQQVIKGDPVARLDDDLETIALDIATRAIEDATRSRDRLAQLMRSSAGTQAALDDADNVLARAELAHRDATLTLARRSLLAPLGGRLGIVSVEAGDRVGTDTVIVTIDDRSTLLIDFRVSERFASRVVTGQSVLATAFSSGGEIEGEIVAVGNRVDRDSRTLPVRAAIDNADDRLRPGMSFSVQLRFAGESLPSIDPLALQWDSNGSFVWQVVDGKAMRTAARIVQRNPESILVQGDLVAGDDVVTEGVLSLREGASVRVAGAAREGADVDTRPERRDDAAPGQGQVPTSGSDTGIGRGKLDTDEPTRNRGTERPVARSTDS